MPTAASVLPFEDFHENTHWDPPGTSIVLTTLLIAVLHMVGLFPSAGYVPVPF